MGVAEQEKYLNPPGQAGAAGQVVRRINLSYIWLRVVVTASIMCTRAKKKEREREREREQNNTFKHHNMSNPSTSGGSGRTDTGRKRIPCELRSIYLLQRVRWTVFFCLGWSPLPCFTDHTYFNNFNTWTAVGKLRVNNLELTELPFHSHWSNKSCWFSFHKLLLWMRFETILFWPLRVR